MKSDKKIILFGLTATLIIVAGTFMTGCIDSEKQSGFLQGFEVHEWGIFQQEYNSNIVNVVSNPITGPVFARKPVIYFHYDEDITDVVVEVDFNGDVLVTIPDAVNTSSGISWTVDIVNNSVVVPNGTAYDYLFYECQINVSQGVIAYIIDDGVNVTFYVKNVASYIISDIFFIYGYPTNVSMWQRGITYIHIDSLESGEQTSITIPLKNNSSYDTSEILLSLTDQGLTQKEAQDLIDYWEQFWFYPTNMESYAQMIYSIPQDAYDELLPISITPAPEIMKRIGLFFITNISINQPLLTDFEIDENCSANPWDESQLGVKEINWSEDNKSLEISANVSINCAFEIGNGSVKLEDGVLKLEYEVIRYGDIVALCICAQEITFVISNLNKDDYEIELVPIDVKLEIS